MINLEEAFGILVGSALGVGIELVKGPLIDSLPLEVDKNLVQTVVSGIIATAMGILQNSEAHTIYKGIETGIGTTQTVIGAHYLLEMKK